MTNDKNKKPVFEKRLNHIRLAVWEQSNDKGKWHNVTLSRRYQDDNGDWKDSHTFNGLADLALASEAIRLAREFVADAERAAAEQTASK